VTVTIDDIKAIFPGSTVLTDAVITDALDTATVIVNEQLRPACSLTEDRYDKITKYLTCHIVSISIASIEGSAAGGALTRDKLGQADQSYSAPDMTSFGLNSTRWGQMALVLDTCGKLSSMNSAQVLKAQFRVIGGTES